MAALVFVSFLLTSATARTARAEEPIAFDRDEEALVVRSSPTHWNFLLRLPGSFRRVPGELEPPARFLLRQTAANDKGVAAELGLRSVKLSDAAASQPLADRVAEVIRKSRAELKEPSKPVVTREGWRTRARFRGRRQDGTEVERILLLIQDDRLWLEFHGEIRPGGKDTVQVFLDLMETLTILDSRAPEDAPASAEELKPKRLEHEFYRIQLLKPLGFERRPVDRDRDQGLLFSLRRREGGNLCLIRIYVWTERTLKKELSQLAREAGTRFEGKAEEEGLKIPKNPRRTRWNGCDSALKMPMKGRQRKSGVPMITDYRCGAHGNGRVYEVELTTFGAASREFRKEIAAFWKKLKFTKPPGG